jgi:SAM-dependent methyltransferase
MGKFLVLENFTQMTNKKLNLPHLLKPVAQSYEWSIKKYGPNHRAAAWRDAKRQQRRFNIFIGLIAYDTDRKNISINDLGCGYGAMFDSFKELPQFSNGTYFGYDISKSMINTAKVEIKDSRAQFILNHEATKTADYSFVSGTYNMKMAANDDEWQAYIKDSIIQLWSKTDISLGFNMLNVQSPLREATLYYADPTYYMEFCQKYLKAKVRIVDLLHPNEFVIFIRK